MGAIRSLALLACLACSTANSSLIDRLAGEQLPVTYAPDGAGDDTVMVLSAGPDGRVADPPSALKDIVLAGDDAIPLLIVCLDDSRPTTATYGLKTQTRVPLGFVCLDVLLHIANGPVHVDDCADDGMGACVKSDYYFLPDAPARSRAIVKRKWQELWDQKLLTFQRPSWWRPSSDS